MQLQYLVDYFNDRYEQEHDSNYRPLILQDGLVNGCFGPVRLGSVFAPVRDAAEAVVGHIAQLTVASHDFQQVRAVETGNLLNSSINQPADLVTVINFDRLCRTVHLLNYLAIANSDGKLFLDVDPRHILAVKQDHGNYFEEVVRKCGLKTQNVVVSMTLNSDYIHNYNQLLDGLNNYRRRGYEIAFNSGYRYTGQAAQDFLIKSPPDYLRVNAPKSVELNASPEQAWLSDLSRLKEALNSSGGRALLQQIDKKEQALLAAKSGFELVQGAFYDNPLAEQCY